MPDVEDYHRRWRDAAASQNLEGLAWDVDITPRSVVIIEMARSTPMGDGAHAFRDFGDAICFYRYYRIPTDLDLAEPSERHSDNEIARMLPGLVLLEQSWEQRRPHLTERQLRERGARAAAELDTMLLQYTREGYQDQMAERLPEIVNTALIDFELDALFILPKDLDRLFADIGHPLADYEAHDSEEQAAAAAPTFDWDNPQHREALKEHIETYGT